MNGFELGILDYIRNNLSCKALDLLFGTVTHLGDGGIFCIALTVMLLIFKKTRRIGVTAAIAMAMGFIIGNLAIKGIVGRIRPYDLNHAIELIVGKPHDSSFPSGHTLVTTEVALSVFFYNKKWGTAALIIAGLVALSRIYLYMHYPSDVLAALILATAITFFAKHLTDKIYLKVGNRKTDI